MLSYGVKEFPNIQKDKKIILPISMNQPYERGDRLKAILSAIEKNGHKENTTILICDYLNRFNCSEEESLQQGKVFFQEHQDMLSGFKIKYWKPFVEEREQKFKLELKKIEANSQEGSQFLLKMKKMWKKCMPTSLLENSIKYQREEFAIIGCMDEFDIILYPKKIGDSLSFLYNHIEGNKPFYHQIKVSEFSQKKENQNKQENITILNPGVTSISTFGKNRKKRPHNSLPLVGRVLISQLETILDSPELSFESKERIADDIENLIKLKIRYLASLNKKEIKEETIPLIQSKA